MIESLVDLRDVTVWRGGRRVLDIPALSLARGERLAVIGPNGAGKTTLLEVLALLRRPDRGRVCFAGEAVPARGAPLALRRRTALLLQAPLLLDRPVRDNVALGPRLRGERDARARALDWLSRLGIAHLAERPARALSGGEAQRVSLARALACAPELLLLDEPFAALDPPARAALQRDLDALLRATQTSAVIVSHDHDEARTGADRLAVLLDGRLRQIDAPDAVFATPNSPAVARFVGVETIWPGEVVGQTEAGARVRVRDQLTVAAAGAQPLGARVWVCLRPEVVRLSAPAQRDDSPLAINRWPGRVVNAWATGGVERLEIDIGVPLVAHRLRSLRAPLNLMPGAPVIATVAPGDAHLIFREPDAGF